VTDKYPFRITWPSASFFYSTLSSSEMSGQDEQRQKEMVLLDLGEALLESQEKYRCHLEALLADLTQSQCCSDCTLKKNLLQNVVKLHSELHSSTPALHRLLSLLRSVYGFGLDEKLEREASLGAVSVLSDASTPSHSEVPANLLKSQSIFSHAGSSPKRIPAAEEILLWAKVNFVSSVPFVSS
jgi:hypothetical protein